MKKLILFFFVALSSPVFAETFLLEGEEEIRSRQLGNTEVYVLEDFLIHSIEEAKVLSYEELDDEKDMVLVERNGTKALLVPEYIFNLSDVELAMISMAGQPTGGTCAEQCNDAAIAGAIAGGIAGAVGGGEAGAKLGALGGPKGVVFGGAGGVILGGGLGTIGGFMGARNQCVTASGCKLPEVKNNTGG